MWDVFWGQTDSFPMLYRYHNPLRQKNRNSKKNHFWAIWSFLPPYRELYKMRKVTSKESSKNEKKVKFFFFELLFLSILLQFLWLQYEKASILKGLKTYNNGFLISDDPRLLCCFEHSTCISLKKCLKVHFFAKNEKFDI